MRRPTTEGDYMIFMLPPSKYQVELYNTSYEYNLTKRNKIQPFDSYPSSFIFPQQNGIMLTKKSKYHAPSSLWPTEEKWNDSYLI